VRLLVYDHMHGEDIVEDKYGFLLLEHVVKLHKQLIRLQDDQLVRLDVMLARYVLSHIIDVNISRLNVNYVKDVIHTQEVKFVTRLLVFVLCTRGANHYLYLLSQLIERLDTIVFAVELKIDYYVSVPARRVWWLYMFVYLLYTVARFDVSMKVKRNLMEHMNQYRLHYLGRGMSWLVDDPLWGYALWSYTIDELNDWALDMFREIGGYCVAHDIAQHIIKHPIDVRCDPDHMEITDEGEGDRIVATIIGRLPSRILS
jgi:hypothetical protein